MASSDDEGDPVPHTVSDYKFVDNEGEPITFSELPLQLNENEQLDKNRKPIFLHGSTDSGLQQIYKRVTAWRFDLSNVKPEISVLSKDKIWISLQKPKKSFESMIRTILITVHCLHYVKKNPEISGKSLWEYLSKVFRTWDVRPSEKDLADHTSLISEAVKRDETLAKSKFLVSFLEEKPQKKKKAIDEDVRNAAKPGFIVDDDEIDELEDDCSEDEEDLFDTVCSICDNGGDLLCCEGRCMRSFHATVEAGVESNCESLCLTDEQVEAIQNFVCKNCQYKQHQCFACGRLGSSDKLSGAEVFSCVSATCGRFYHPHCVAKLLHRENAVEADKLQKKIADGESFTCPIHKCSVCKQGEDKTDPDLQFAVCRRCPKSYHRKCLPRKIGLEDDEDNDITQRGWEGLIPDRILIYCLKHEIDDEIATPVRDHIKFPDDGCKKKKPVTEELLSKEKVPEKPISMPPEGASRKRTLEKSQKGVDLSSQNKENASSLGSGRRSSVSASSKKQKVESSKKPSPGTTSLKVRKPLPNKNEPSLGDRLFDVMVNKGPTEETPKDEQKKALTKKPIAKELKTSVQLDADAKQRILDLMKDATSSITMEQILAEHSVPSTHVRLSKNGMDKTVTVGKVEGSVEATRAALQKLEKGCSIEDAKAVCEPQLLRQLDKWKNKLKVYLAPFLYGMRYTSFGRHFTKEDKLKEIVDFCCGSNDFSCLMKKKLDEVGKKCSYKNYDILQAKNDFNFEKRDWMTVQPKELPKGSQLIMGLNPPFGKDCSLANWFINKALEFKPKLIILIVPQETERLDKKRNPYDLVWEDNVLLAGKSFYLPGSVDVNDNQLEDWNIIAPPLFLWSHPDWTSKHKAIARQHGHLSTLEEPEQPHPQVGRGEPPSSDYPLEDHDSHDLSLIPKDNHPNKNEVPRQGLRPSESPKEEASSTRKDDERIVHRGDNSRDKDQSTTSAKKRKRDKGKFEGSQRGSERGQSSATERYHGRRSPPNVGDGRSLDRRSSRTFEAPSRSEVSKEADPRYDQNFGAHRSNFETGYGEANDVCDIVGGYRMNNSEPYLAPSRWTSDTGSGPRNSVERFVGYERESVDSLRSGAHLSEIEDINAVDLALRTQQIQMYGPPDPVGVAYGQRSGGFLGGQDPMLLPYGHLRSAADTSYSRTNTSSTMQRYAPRLDELNHPRANTFAAEPPRNGIPDHMAPLPGYRPDALGFAPGPYRSYSQHNSSGWLNE